MQRILAIGVMVTALLSAASPGAAAPPQRTGIEVLNVTGTGCRADTTTVAVSPDNEAFTVTYSGYLAQAGPGTSKSEARRDCRLNLKIRPPQGYAYTVSRADYRGYVELGPGATATQRANYRFAGPRPADHVHTFAGPLADNWQSTDAAEGAALAFGGCGAVRVLSIDTELTVTAGNTSETSYVAMDSADGTLQSTYRFAWRRCG